MVFAPISVHIRTKPHHHSAQTFLIVFFCPLLWNGFWILNLTRFMFLKDMVALCFKFQLVLKPLISFPKNTPRICSLTHFYLLRLLFSQKQLLCVAFWFSPAKFLFSPWHRRLTILETLCIFRALMTIHLETALIASGIVCRLLV